MAKPTTTWTDNSSKTTTVTYNSSTVTYNSATTRFSGWDVTLPSPSKNVGAWAGATKLAQRWDINSASVSTDTYDKATQTYDTIYTAYDGNQSVTASPLQTKQPANWSTT